MQIPAVARVQAALIPTVAAQTPGMEQGVPIPVLAVTAQAPDAKAGVRRRT